MCFGNDAIRNPAILGQKSGRLSNIPHATGFGTWAQVDTDRDEVKTLPLLGRYESAADGPLVEKLRSQNGVGPTFVWRDC